MQKAANRLVKDGFSPCNSRPFASQFAAFYKTEKKREFDIRDM